MRRIILWAMSTTTLLVLLFNYHTSLSSTVAVSAPSASSQVSGTTSPSTPAGADPPTGTTTTPTQSDSAVTGNAATTFDGQTVMTQYGAVQVQITVVDGKVTAAQALQAPMADRHDQMINSRAIPIYNGEVVDAQSAQIDVVSGATYTWGGYTESLQSALDQANL